MYGIVGVLLSTLTVAGAQEASAPRRQIPPSVLVELAALEDRFDLAVAADCDDERCFSKGCTYVAHVVADRPQAASLPGLGGEPGPGSVDPQAWLTSARCTFAHEDGIAAEDVAALARRLQTKVSTGWTVVTVGHQALQALPAYLEQPPAPEVPAEAEPPPPPTPEPWTLGVAGRELWATLLDDFPWMIALGMSTMAATALIWAWRRVGRETFEEKLMLAELARGEAAPASSAEAPSAEERVDDGFVAEQTALWQQRLGAMEPERPDVAVQAMIRDLLRAGELPLLAKAVTTFPDTLPRAFPTGGDIASAKLDLAEYLKTADASALPSDAELFRALNRHALAASLATQRDAEIVRSLREEFGPAGLVALIEAVPARAGALLFALAPAEAQHEVARLLTSPRLAALAEPLLRSNRMGPAETAYLFEVLEAARVDAEIPGQSGAAARPPVPPPSEEASDHGATFDATGALSLLLPRLDPADRAAVLDRALRRFGGSLPAWYAGILVPDMLFELSDEARADLLLSVDADAVAAWLSVLDADFGERLLGRAPASLRASVRGAGAWPSQARRLAAAEQGRRELARGFQAQLARARVPFEQVVEALAEAGAA